MSAICSYSLASVNGQDLPAVWRQVEAPNGDRIRSVWTGGRLLLDAAGRYSVSLSGELQVGGRTDRLHLLETDGSWCEAGPGDLELRSRRGGTSRWQASSDGTVLVGRALHRRAAGPGSRTTFVFLRD
jgi:hypothetical protein